METGFNIVEVPGSKSRKVAEKKQQWYRTANLKMFLQNRNLLHFSTFQRNSPVIHTVLDSKLIPVSFDEPATVNNLISPADPKSAFNFKLQNTIRFFSGGRIFLLVKSSFSPIYDKGETDFSRLAIFSYKRTINLKNR